MHSHYQRFKYNLRSLNPRLPCKQIKEMYNNMFPDTINPIAYGSPNIIAYNTAEAVPKCYPPRWGAAKQIKNQEGNTPMTAKVNFNTALNVAAPATNIEATQRDFTVKRIYDTYNKHGDALRPQFKMDANDRPRTAKDLIDAIKNDDFTLDQKMLDNAGEDIKYYNNEYGIRWGKGVPDTAGYKLAGAALREAMQAAIDEATLSPVEQLQDVLKKFQAWTYTPAV